MKKYMETLKMYNYQFMNPQMNPSFNPNIPSNIGPGLNPQFGMPMHMGNPYLNYPGNPAINPYGQFKNMPHPVAPGNMPYGMNPFTGPTNISPVYPPQYLNHYPNQMMSGYSQPPPPHSYAHMIGLEKNDITPKINEYPNFVSHH